MYKFGRNYQLEVQMQTGELLVIGLPFTIEFDITRKTLGDANVGQVRIYNLSPLHREQIRFNVYEYGSYRQIRLKAGYGTSLTTIFQGNMNVAWSVREGVNFITQIECYDGGYAYVNGVTNRSFPAGTPKNVEIATIMQDLPHTTVGTIGPSYNGVLSRTNVYSGNTANILSDITGGGFFIDNGVANALGTNEYVIQLDQTTLINSSTGLLGTPVLEQDTVRFDMLFEPTLNIGQKIKLESLGENSFNNEYKVTGVKHRGMISQSVAGSVITTGEFLKFRIAP